MALGRSAALGSDELKPRYGDQRQEWSQHLKVLREQLTEPEFAEVPSSNQGDDVEVASDGLA